MIKSTSIRRSRRNAVTRSRKKPQVKNKKVSLSRDDVTRGGASKKLVIVESPTKARAISAMLGNGYRVVASFGHICDLPKHELGVNPQKNFLPTYVILPEKAQRVEQIRQLAKSAEEIWLATDPDREGEAIAWHLKRIILAGGRNKPLHRAEFHEITPEGVLESFSHPRDIDINRVNAQQARRILDRLVGYELSPFLARAFANNRLSAGRVQSAALRLVVERDRAIRAFRPSEYWVIDARLSAQAGRSAQPPTDKSFVARLKMIDRQPAKVESKTQADAICCDVKRAAWVVEGVQRRRQKRPPHPPFTTSTLQQAANRILGFSAERTMQIAQRLYEGVSINGNLIGLITYMRTDSTAVAERAQKEAMAYIRERIGEAYVPLAPRKARDGAYAQGAHEAIRPTSIYRHPDDLRTAGLSAEEHLLYELIWRRFLGSQMADAVEDVIEVSLLATNPDHRYLFAARGTTLVFDGFMAVMREEREGSARKGTSRTSSGDAEQGEDDLDEQPFEVLAALQTGTPLVVHDILATQKFTQPPPHYTDATLIRTMERLGIGRPSTYAQTLTTLVERDYVTREGKKIIATATGEAVLDLLLTYFSPYIDIEFTARIEGYLDQIEAGKTDWQAMLRDFYEKFHADVLSGMNNQAKGAHPPSSH